MGFMKGGGSQYAPPQLPAAPPPPPVLGAAPAAKKPQRKAMSPSFLSQDATPSTANKSDKTLLGQ